MNMTHNHASAKSINIKNKWIWENLEWNLNVN